MALTERAEVGNVLFLGIVNGKFTQKVTDQDPGAQYRKYVAKDGAVSHIYEIIHKNLTGYITKLNVMEGKFGQQLLIEIRDNKEVARAYINVKSAYFSNFCKRLPNIDLGTKVTLNPYSFIPSGKSNTLSGITVYQEGSKVNNFYWDTTTKKYVGLPEPYKQWDELTTIERSAYYLVLTQYFIETVSFFNSEIPDSKEQLAAYDYVATLGAIETIPEPSDMFGDKDPNQPEL